MKTPMKPPPYDRLLGEVLADSEGRGERMVAILTRSKPTVGGRYRHWDNLRHLEPPQGLTSAQWWVGIKSARNQILDELPLRDGKDSPFMFAHVAPALAMLRRIDQEASGQIALSEVVTTPDSRKRYLVSSLIEEAITSSQLEGAATSRRVAKEMLRSGRRPRNKSEQMIVNNFRGMNLVRENATRPLTPALVLSLHRVLTQDTLDDPSAAGRLQTPEDDRVAIYDEEGNVLHTPPPADQLPNRLQEMCKFANTASQGDEYLHPVVRAIVLHFWIGHDHPFEDGNGRTARALFYWSMLNQGYWLTEYLTISTILKKARAKYARSFLYTESDDNDLTYFVLYQLDVIVRAIEALRAFLQRKMKEVQETEILLKKMHLNYRQVALLTHALRNPDAQYTFKTHATSQSIVYQSARVDLLTLVDQGLLDLRVVGRTYHFTPVSDLVERVSQS